MVLTGGEIIMAGALTTIVAGGIGAVFGRKGKVSDVSCKERQEALSKPIMIELKYIKEAVDDIKKHVNGD